MPNRYTQFFFNALFIALFLFSANAHASHVVGADLYYTHLTGNTYKVTLAVYGDCGPAGAVPFATLSSSTPQVCVYNGATPVATVSLAIEPPITGTEVTPLCPGSISQCSSASSSIPGIKKFVYSATYTFSSASSTWRFIFNGNMGISSAGRTSTITNITSPAATTMQLIDTLNNTTSDNSSPALTVTQSTYFTISAYDAYNPAAVDPDGDDLRFSLTSAMNGTTTCATIGSPVIYTGTAWPGQPITPTTPLQASAGTYYFDTLTGKISFYPSTVQRAVVVYNIREYRSGVLVGTSQREMTIATGMGSPTTPCSGMPTAGTASIGTGCGTAPDTLILTGNSCAGVTLQWQSSPDGVIWTDISGATTSSYVITPAASTYYRCAATCSTSGVTALTGMLFYPVGGVDILHCTISYPSDTECGALNFHLAACVGSGSYSVQTFFGDATSVTSSLSAGSLYTADASHTYTYPGTYSIKQVLYSGSMPVDSLLYSFDYQFCRNLFVKFYNDANSNCVFDAGDNYLFMPVTTQVDSNGVPVDTITATSGFVYKALGGPGTIYTFTVLSAPAGLSAACPSSGVLSDTIVASLYSYPVCRFGFHCTTAGVDLQESAWFMAGQHIGMADITVVNANCTSVNDTVVMNFSPKYAFASATPSPLSVTGTTIKWLPGAISASSSAPQHIQASFHEATTLLTAGDTVYSYYQANPLAGDITLADNLMWRIDTVSASWDPNAMMVSPQGYILAGTQLEYAIHFENTGNDTANNIYILDTLSSYLDFQSIKVTGATADMNLGLFTTGGVTVAKFDFPHINLLDSSHHDLCNGMVRFKINTRSLLLVGTIIPNRAGIYFDINPVVMTNTVNNIIKMEIDGAVNVATDAGSVRIYPNPASGLLNVDIASGNFSAVEISNAIGQRMVYQPIISSLMSINISSLAPGLYYIALKGSTGTVVKKFIRE